MRGRRTRIPATLVAAGLLSWLLPGTGTANVAREPTPWEPVTATSWTTGGGGDAHRTGFNPTEARPAFIDRENPAAQNDGRGPWLEWVTRISDLPSGVWSMAGVLVDSGLVYVSGGATNSFLALDANTGLPVWRFAPDPRTPGHTANYPGSNAPLLRNGIVYVTFSNGFLYALDARTGRKIWSFQATDGYRDTSPAMNPRTDAERANSPYAPESWIENREAFGPVHPGIDYPKIHGATAYCEGTVAFMTLAGWVYGVEAETGRLRWKTYADAPHFPGELVWPEFRDGGALNPANRAAGMSTRRFEAVPGVGCLHGEIQAAGSDGWVRFLDPATGETSEEGGNVGPPFTRVDADGTDFCVAAGFNCDIAIGFADPSSGDYILTTLDSRIIRLSWDTHEPLWRRTYSAPLPLELGGNMPLLLEHREHGFITQAVTGGLMAFDPERRVLFAANQDGRLYVLGIPENQQEGPCPPGFSSIRNEGAIPSSAEPCLIARVGIRENMAQRTPYTRAGLGGPWDHNQHALSGLVLGGDVLYVPTWDNTITAFDVRDPAAPRPVWRHTIEWDTSFRFPPFGETFDEPFSDIDGKIFSSPALVGGRLYLAANDGAIYAFNLHERVETRRTLAILGSGAVPFLPEWEERLGAFDQIWTPADWYRNQVPPQGWAFPAPAGTVGAGTLLASVAALWWYVRRRDDLMEEIEEMIAE